MTFTGNLSGRFRSFSLLLIVLPMGWTWSFYLVQVLHLQLLYEDGFAEEQIMSSAWPAPIFNHDATVALPYCDNLTILGTNRVLVNQTLSLLIHTFEKHGFVLHEIEWASTTGTPLGTGFDGGSKCIRPRPKRAWTLRAALLEVAAGHWVSGRQLERLMGHYVVESLHDRSGLSVPRAISTFI